MSLTNAAEAALLDLLFLNVDWAGIGDAAGVRGSVAAGAVYISLHSADPGEAGTQATSEVAYTGYARVAVTRTAGGWVRSGSAISNAALIQFPQAAGGSATATHFGIGTAASGAGSLILKGALNNALTIANGIRPKFDVGALSATAE